MSAGQPTIMQKLRAKIIETEATGLILPRHKETLLMALEDGTLDFRVPSRVIARIVNPSDQDYGFDIFRCSECGWLYNFEDAVSSRMQCRRCAEAGRRVQLTQAPIFGASYSNRPPTPVPFSEVLRKITFDENSDYCVYNTASQGRSTRLFLKGVKETDFSRPIDSLCWVCTRPQLQCQYRDRRGFCLYSTYEGRNFRPDQEAETGRIRLVASQRVRTRGAFGRFLERYRPITISEGSTKPIRIAVHDFKPPDATAIDFRRDELPGISQVLFVKKLEIFQFSIALAVGLPYASIRKRPAIFLNDIGPDGEERPYVLARQLITEGLVVKLDEGTVNEIIEEWGHRRATVSNETLFSTLYHTVSHALLKPLPMMAGLDASEFGESFSSADNEVSVYDNSPGGIGGVRTIVEEESRRLRGDYVAQLLNSSSCQMDCGWSCKACLHIGNCGWVNRQLQREMMRRIVDERLRDRYYRAQSA